MRFERTDAERRQDALDIGREIAADRGATIGAIQRNASRPETLATSAPEDVLTEAGAAERFARRHGDNLRFDHRRQRYLLWRDHRWVPDADAAVMRLAHDFARDWQREAVEISDRDRREATMKFTIRLERRDGLTNMLWFARTFRPITDAGDGWDVDPWLLGAPNGTIDLRTGALRPGRRADRLTMSTAVPYVLDAACPRWERFIDEIFAGSDALIAFVHRAIGYSLTGLTTEQILLLLYGIGSNGKGTFLNTLMRLLGDHAWNMPFATIELRERSSIPNDVAALAGRRFVIASETNDGTRLNEARVKALTGCDPMTARFLHGEFFTFEPVAKFWLSVNHKPVIRDDSFGFWRRMRLIPFTQQFPVNPDLAGDLRDEASGILAWAVRGCLAWQRDGLAPPTAVIAATRQYEHDSDPLAAFLAEACELDEGAEIGASDLYKHYKQWADEQGMSERERLSATMFGRKLAARFERVARSFGNVYRGVARAHR